MKFPMAEPGTSRKNKTGTWRSFRPVVDKKKCIKCGICEGFCPDSCITIEKDGSTVNYDYCKGCGICANECPVKCIKMEREK